MKLIGNLLMTLGLVVGLLAASTSYLVPADRPDSSFIKSTNDDGTNEYLTVSQPSGGIAKSDDERAALRAQYEAGEISAQDYLNAKDTLDPVLTPDPDTQASPETLTPIKEADVQFVHVKEFGFFRWPHWWAFAGSCAIIFVGAMMVRSATKAEIQAAVNAEHEEHSEELGPRQTPVQLLTSAKASVNAIAQEIASAETEHEMCHVILTNLTNVQTSCMDPFVTQRERLIGQYSMGGFASIMDSFAAAERQINRAWSAAADGHLQVSLDCIEASKPLLDEALSKVS
ncbi:MAG: hypothetical protein ACYTF7_03665 [Planctomycetota bacterium]|jgi:hypothetical protein